MRKYVIWSGGADSTLALYRASKGSSEKTPVTAISFKSNVIGDRKLKMEQKARDSIKPRLPKSIVYSTVTFNVGKGLDNHGAGLHQVNLWLAAALPFVAPNSEIIFGYIRGDDFWHYKHAFEHIFRGMAMISHLKDARLSYPLEWETKAEVIQELRKTNLFNLIWTCENPTKKLKACGSCIPCRNQKAAIRLIDEANASIPKPRRKS